MITFKMDHYMVAGIMVPPVAARGFLAPLSSPSLHYPPLLLEVGPLKIGSLKPSLGVWRSAVSSPNWVWGKAPAANDFDTF